MREYSDKLIHFLLKYSIILIIVFSSSNIYATDYTIADGTTQTSRVTLTNNDTLTVASGGEIDYTWPAVDADNRTFPAGSTTITNNGTIEGSCCVIDIRSSTNPTLVNNGTINGKTSSRTVYANNSVDATITNNGDITILEANDYEAIDGDDSTGMTITNNSGATISSAGDDGIAIEGAEDVTITNAGTISAEDDWGIQADGADGLTITNSGTISAGDIYAIYLRNADDITITNSGTITAARDPINMQSSTGTVTITNSGTISQTGGGYNDGLTLQDNATITNTGTISASRYGIGGSASGVTFVNKGTVTGGTYDFYVPSITITTLTNDQGGDDGLNYRGKLPTNYKIMVNSASDYGKLLSDHTSYLTGTTTLSIDTTSTLAENTYTGVFTNFTSARIAAGTTGTVTASNGVFDWTFSDANSDNTWDLVIVNGDTTDPTLSSSTPADNATSVAVNANIVLTFSEAVDAESGNITIKKTSDNSTIETIDVTGNKVSGSGGTEITVNPGTNWSEKTEYYVLIDASAFDDGNSNSYAGISSTTALSFTTVDSTNPTLSSSTPADDATGIATNSNIVLTFDEAVDAESGNITIKKTSDNSTIETIDVTGSKVSGSGGTQITVNPGTDWAEQTEHYVLIDASAFDDTAGNSYAGISSTTALSFTSADETNPSLSSSSPTDNATGIATNSNIVLTFSETVDAESGNITIKKTSDDSTIETIDVTGSKVTGNASCGGLGGGTCGTIITINPGTDWAEQTEHYVLIDASAFDDSNGNSYAGISSTTALSFTTGDETNPTLSSSTPADNGTDILVDANIVLTFSEAVDAESGNITIKKKKDNSTVETIDVTGSKVRGSGGTQITINPGSDLENEIEFYILIDATAFDDTSGNSYAGISSTTALNFKTKPGEVFSETVKTLTKNQSAASVQTMAQSLTRVNSRMNYIRPGSNNTFRQNIRLAMNFDDPFANQLFDSLAQKFLKPKKETKGWAVWTEGNVAFGRIANHDGNLGQDIHSDGITIGIDKKKTENKTIGFAINKSWQETEVGSNDANMDAAAISLMTYGSFKLNENTFFEAAVGLGEMDIDLDRKVTDGRNLGVRKGNQLFGSFTYLLEPDIEDEEKNINYYTRVDLGFTQLGDYTETGDSTAVSYNKQNVKSGSLSAGFNLRKIIEISNGILTPLLKFELGKDKTKNSLSEAYYVTNSSEIYTNAISDQTTGHGLLSLGLGAQFDNNLTINATYDHYRSTNETFMNSFTINFRKSF